jgi:regulator of protease activity HflC (stomatin/prohibitin superfamily)
LWQTTAVKRLHLISKNYFIMVFIILGIVAFIVAAGVKKGGTQFGSFVGPIRIAGFVFILIGLLTSCIVQIDAGHVGVKKLFGKVKPDVLSSGLHIVNPFYEIIIMDVKTQNYTMSGVNDESMVPADDAIKVLTADGLEVSIDLTVLYRLIPGEAPRMVQETGLDYRDKVVRPLTRTKIRENAVYYDAIALYSTKRDEFQERIVSTIEADFKARGLLLEQLLVRNITLPASVKTTIEQKINAEQEAQKMQFVLQKETQEAERKRVEAQGIVDYQRIINTGLTEKQLRYEAIKAQLELAKSPNSKIIIMGDSKTPVILDSKN